MKDCEQGTAEMGFANLVDAEEMVLSLWEEDIYHYFHTLMYGHWHISEALIAIKTAYNWHWEIQEVPYFE